MFEARQYIGQGTGDNQFSSIVIELDELGENLVGQCYAIDADIHSPSVTADIVIPKGLSTWEGEIRIEAFNPWRRVIVPRHQIEDSFPGYTLSQNAYIQLECNAGDIQGIWKTLDENSPRSGNIALAACKDLSRSLHCEYATELTWADFKNKVSNVKYGDFLFRGQAYPWRLQTTFHRSKRSSLYRYFQEVLPAFQRALGPSQDLSGAGLEGYIDSLLHLAQHHGLPTPTMDWSYSPFVSAYFAFADEKIDQNFPDEKFVYIFQFRRRSFDGTLNRFESYLFAPPFIRFFDPLPIQNHRSAPQHGLSMATNVVDVELFVDSLSKQSVPLLEAFKIRRSEREQALKDLMMMNIAPHTLFPGMDGISQSLKYRFFS